MVGKFTESIRYSTEFFERLRNSKTRNSKSNIENRDCHREFDLRLILIFDYCCCCFSSRKHLMLWDVNDYEIGKLWNWFFGILASNGSNSTIDFEGFCVDILLELARRLNFSFEIEIVKDKIFGKKNEKGEWNGIIGELVNRVTNKRDFCFVKRFYLIDF